MFESEGDSGSQDEPEEHSCLAMMEKEEKKVKEKKRRLAGELSGRQLAILQLKREAKKGGAVATMTWPAPALSTVAALRKVITYFEDGEENVFSNEAASAMRVYFLRKCGITTKNGYNSTLTNLFKVALLPGPLYHLAMEVGKLYEAGDLAPPSASKQRQRRTISPSSYSFLTGLDPRNGDDQLKIKQLLEEWRTTGIRPTLRKDAAQQAQTIQKLCHELEVIEKDYSVLQKNYEDLETKIQSLEQEIASEKEKSAFLIKENEKLMQELSGGKQSEHEAKEKSIGENVPERDCSTTTDSEVETCSKRHKSRCTERAALRVTQDKHASASRKRRAALGVTVQSGSGKLPKQVRGWAYVPELTFEKKNIFQEEQVTSRLRGRRSGTLE